MALVHQSEAVAFDMAWSTRLKPSRDVCGGSNSCDHGFRFPPHRSELNGTGHLTRPVTPYFFRKRTFSIRDGGPDGRMVLAGGGGQNVLTVLLHPPARNRFAGRARRVLLSRISSCVAFQSTAKSTQLDAVAGVPRLRPQQPIVHAPLRVTGLQPVAIHLQTVPAMRQNPVVAREQLAGRDNAFSLSEHRLNPV